MLSPGQRVTGIDARMRPGATIAGTVTNQAGQAQSRVCAIAEQPGDAYTSAEVGFPVAGTAAISSQSGGYRISNLAAGRYAMEFAPCGHVDFQYGWFGGRPGTTVGDIVDLGAARAVRDVDTSMTLGGAIRGSITDSKGKPVIGVCEIAVNRRTGADFAGTDFAPSYQLASLPPGRYAVEFYSCLQGVNYGSQWYGHASTESKSATVVVAAGQITGAVNARMATGGSLSGRLIAAATGKPVPYFCVEAQSASDDGFGFGETRRDGDYSVRGLASGRYHLIDTNCDPTRNGAAAVLTSKAARVTAGHRTSGFNVAVPAGGSISGRLSAGSPASTGQGDVCVIADPLDASHLQGSASSGHTGHYAITNLQAGRYRVYFDPVDDCDYTVAGLRPQWYDDVATRAKATVVTVAAGQAATGISAALQTDGGIAGTVTAASSGSSLTGVCVRAVPVTAGRTASFTATTAGAYQLTGLAPGRYTVQFRSGCGATGYRAQWWQGASSAAKATVITVTAGTTRAGIDAALRK